MEAVVRPNTVALASARVKALTISNFLDCVCVGSYLNPYTSQRYIEMAEHDLPLAMDDREDYNSASDEDFSPPAEVPSDAESASSSEDEASTTKARGTKRKRKTVVIDAELDSGDEEAVKEYRAHKEDDSGGEGGLIKTRAQRRAE